MLNCKCNANKKVNRDKSHWNAYLYPSLHQHFPSSHTKCSLQSHTCEDTSKLTRYLITLFCMQSLAYRGIKHLVVDGEVQLGGNYPGGRYSQKNWVGVCGPLPKTLTLFMNKICDIPNPIYDLTKNSKPNLWPDPHIKILFQTCILISSVVQTNFKLP